MPHKKKGNKKAPKSPPKEKRRNSEKRKEKSRDAARCRRGKESEIFTELANALPLPAQTISQLDKASVMRLTIAFLKTRSLCQAGFTKKCEKPECGKLELEMDVLLLKALDGFLLVLSTEGDIIYSSENIVTFLGLPQVDVMGNSLYDYTHPCDHDEVRELVSAKSIQEPRHAFLRLKCTLTAKGRSVNLKSASYKVVRVSGEMVRDKDESWLVALGMPVPHPSNIEFPLDKQTFVSKHSLDMKFTYVDDNVGEFCGYEENELIGRSLYEMHHALDSDLIKDAYKTLRSKGQVETGRYRFLAREGGYVWVVTQATLIHGPKDHKPQCVVCLNYIVSGVESPGEVLSELQFICSNKKRNLSRKSLTPPLPLSPVVSTTATPAVPKPKLDTQPKVPEVVNRVPAPLPPVQAPLAPPPIHRPVAATSKIFTTRTEEMNKGYLMFSDSGIVLKDEPDDLTHLAPSRGDSLERLDVATFIPDVGDMFPLNYKQISNVDLLLTSPTSASVNSDEQTNSPKYSEYEVTDDGKISGRLSEEKITINKSGRASPSSACSSPAFSGLRTPEPPKPLVNQAFLIQSSPGNKLPLKGVVESSRPRTTTESMFTHLDVVTPTDSNTSHFTNLEPKLEENMDDEFDLRAPYIPLTNELLMLNQEDLMWGAQPESIIARTSHSNKRDSKCSAITLQEEDSSLAQLLRDRDPPIAGPGPGPGPVKTLRSENPPGPQRAQYQQSKFLDGGGSFVDPNKVLPGHFGGIDDGGGDDNEDDLHQVVMPEPVEPPPPLTEITDTGNQLVLNKRRHSPSSSPILSHKKLCSLLCDHQQQQRLQQQGQESLQQQQQQQHQVPQMQVQPPGVRELTTPYAPTMQQLLISKEPITVRGGRPGGGVSTPLTLKGKDSVLRNLLVSGRDDSAGYSVSTPPSPASTPSRSSTISPGPHLISFETKGGKNIGSDGDDSSHAGDPQTLRTTVRIPQDIAMLFSDGGAINASSQLPYPKLRILTGGQSSLLQPASCLEGGGGGGGGGGMSGESTIRRGRRQDLCLLMDPDTTFPNLFDLSQLDYEVNAPANNSSLLQGADLLMALDQSL